MAGVANTTRMSAQLARRLATAGSPARRGFRIYARNAAAHNFSMPALSPTMTEGNIAAWRVKEGDSFSAGDVLLEIETDKATMDVEAQDDGILVKVTQQDGSKGVKVGQRIAVTADPEDDISSLEIPAEESSAQTPKPDEKKSSQKQAAKQTAESGAQKESKKPKSTSKSADSSRQATQGGKAQKQTYPLYPSVEALLHQNGLSSKDADSIPATGPGGRLLKGDVLAFLGQINKEYPAQVSERVNKLSHLDLSNIQVAKPAPKAETAPKTASEPEEIPDTEVAVPISLSNVIAVQKRVKDSLGIFLPLSTFIERASDLANQDLPRSKTRAPSADELFDAVLGLDKIPTASSGNYFPLISGISPLPPTKRGSSARKIDLIDLLTSSSEKKKQKASKPPTAIGVSADHNVFSVVAPVGEERRAEKYLERMKFALEQDPGRLVL